MQNLKSIEDRIKESTKEGSFYEPWQGYYQIRGREIENLLRLAKLDKLGRSLDIGCGNGFTSYLLSKWADKMVASDLKERDSLKHSMGIESLKGFLSRISKHKIEIFASSIEKTPFEDNSFDTIFSLYTLQYLEDKNKALGELKRIVKKDGLVILMLPSFIERIYAVIQLYLYFFIKGLNYLRNKIFNIKTSNTSDNTQLNFSKFKENYKHFPFPGPHGAYKNSFIEMIKHMPFNWNNNFKRNGFKIIKTFTTSFLPYPLILTVSLKTGDILSKITKDITVFLGNKPFIKYFGYNYCVVLKK